MVEITVTADLATQIIGAQDSVVLLGPDGKRIGYVDRPAFTEEEVREAEKRLDQPDELLTFQEVMTRLRALEQE